MKLGKVGRVKGARSHPAQGLAGAGVKSTMGSGWLHGRQLHQAELNRI
jgi:hypothetical protein